MRNWQTSLAWLACSLVGVSCGNEGTTPAPSGESATISAALSEIPQAIHCLRITASGVRTVRRVFNMSPGANPVTLDVRLPVGKQSLLGEAFEDACPPSGSDLTADPIWISDPTDVTLAADTVTNVFLSLHRASNMKLNIDFQDAGDARGLSVGDARCVVMADTTVRCWGPNIVGNVGDDTREPRLTPVPVPGLSGVRSLAAANLSVCAALFDGTARCWGANRQGQLGDGSDQDRTVPTPVTGLSNVRSIALGDFHACALMEDGTVQCWGQDALGQLGYPIECGTGGAGLRACFVPVPKPVPGLSGVRQIAAGGEHTCALLADQTVRCWGSNTSGELGGGTVALNGVHQITAGTGLVDATGGHSCALLDNGKPFCWGANAQGQLGDGTRDKRETPKEVAGIMDIQQIMAANAFTCAVLDEDDAVRCWGANDVGQLGDATTTPSNLPVSVKNLTSVQTVAGGINTTCALTFSGAVFCWGSGPLGDGTSASSSIPVQVRF